MNKYIVNQDIKLLTRDNQKVLLKQGTIVVGGYDLRKEHFDKNRCVLFIEVNGTKTESYLDPGQEFISKFKFIGHSESIDYIHCDVYKRPRINKMTK